MMENSKKNWIFTFGCGTKNRDKVIKIFGTYGEAREKMCEKFGTDWAFQYSEEEWNEWLTSKERSLVYDYDYRMEVIE